MPKTKNVGIAIAQLLFGLFVIGLGAVVVVGTTWLIYDDYLSVQWAPEYGIVTDSKLAHVSRYGPTVNITYTYSFQNNTYRGHCCSKSYFDEIEEVTRNPPGKTVEILVNPNNPSQSRLKSNVQAFDLVVANSFRLLFAIVGTFLGFLGIKHLYKNVLDEKTAHHQSKPGRKKS